MASNRRQYPFHLIEPKWQNTWDKQQTFRAWNPGEPIPADHPFGLRHGLAGKNPPASELPPKFYILDMFPYPSGAGLHVGHPEGYTATDILARYRRAQGFNVLHPMGWDAFGLPAEQYAVKTGQHPRQTTEQNIATFKRQIQSLGFSYDWSRELATTDPDYFKWTQWVFLKLYNSWFNPKANKAEPIETLQYPDELTVKPLNRETVETVADSTNLESARRTYRDSKRLACVTDAPVWWCPALGTVLANEEVVDGKSEVGGHPVERKPMRQWMLRITAYAEKLLADLDTIDWSDSLKEMQRNWIGRSEGAEVNFTMANSALGLANKENSLRVFTTRPDTLFGATYMVLAPEHKLVDSLLRFAKESFPVNGKICANLATVFDAEGRALGIKPLTEALELVRVRGVDLIQLSSVGDMAVCIAQDHGAFRFAQQEAVKHTEVVLRYREAVAKKSDLERTELAKEKTGVFTGAYAINPVNGEKIPIWIADYVLASYGTGAIMAVPAHDERDYTFAHKFKLPIRQVVLPAEAGYDKAVWHYREMQEAFPTYPPLVIQSLDPDGSGGSQSSSAFTGDGFAFNSANSDISLNGLPTAEAKKKITDWLEAKGLGKRTINYKLRDWLFSRQRYWGEPFPIVWKRGPDGQSYHEALPESALPVLPPALTDYKPTATGEPPLARAKDWVNLPDGSTRETNTMPQWAGSCWYYLRYLDAKNAQSFVGRDAEQYWMGGRNQEWEKQLRELYDFALNNPKNEKRFVTFGKVSNEEAKRLESQTGLKLAGCRRFIDNYAIAHILHEHGNSQKEAERGLVAITFEDFLLIPEIVKWPDHVSHAGKTAIGLDGILYEKKINGWICYVEEIRTKHDLLATKTFYKKPATASHAGKGLAQTSETLRRTEPNVPATRANDKTATPGVDLYVGGTEHAVLHLLYARFWHKVLFDLGYVSTPEPFFKLVNQGLILGEDGQKMSKSRGNVVNPDDILVDYGADAFRLYEMFMGPLQDTKPWSTKGVEGVYRFLGRVWRLFVDENSETAFEQAETLAGDLTAENAKSAEKRNELLDLILLDGAITDIAATPVQLKALHQCIKKVTEDLDGLRFNTAISAMMVFVNEANTWQSKPLSAMKTFLQLLAPFAPHLAEELWARLHSTFGQIAPSLTYAPWPQFDPALLVEQELEIPVSVNGKLRDVIKVPADADNATLEAAARASDKVKSFLDGKTIKKVIVVPKKMVNIVVV